MYALSNFKRFCMAVLAIIMIITLCARYPGLAGTSRGFCELAMMSVLASLCLSSVFESAAKGFKAGAVIFIIGVASNALRFFGLF